MDSRVQVLTFASLLSLALAGHVFLRRDRERLHRAFAAFAVGVALLEATSLMHALHPSDSPWNRLRSVGTVVVAYLAMGFFRAFVREKDGRTRWLGRVTTPLALLVLALLATPFYGHPLVMASVVGFVLLSFYATLATLHRFRLETSSRREAERMRFLTLTGGLAGLLTLADFLPPIAEIDVGAVAPLFLVGFLYMLSQAVVRERMLDLYDLAGRAGVLAALAVMLAMTLAILARITGSQSFAHAFVAAIVVLLVLEPLQVMVERWIHRLFFVDRYELGRILGEARGKLAAALDAPAIAEVAIDALETSGRVTHAAIWFVEPGGRAYALAGHLGPPPPERLEPHALRPLLERIAREGTVIVEVLERELDRHRRREEDREAETVFEVLQNLEAMHASVVVPLHGTDALPIGLLAVRDERMRDAYAHDEVQVLTTFGTAIGASFERSVQYRSAKERDRLIALGEMSAGLAHEIRNPLGAIKATAQHLADPDTTTPEREFLDIIVDEVDRLDRVVSAFLDYARPSTSDASICDPSATLERTLQLLEAEPLAQGPSVSLHLERPIPAVKIDAEKLRQVVWNLARNALEALDGRGELRVRVSRSSALVGEPPSSEWVEIVVSDTGPGIDETVLPNLFVPFVTTKPRGTGLGLAMSQRLVATAGGRIAVRSEKGRGATFIVRLPAATPPPDPALPSPHEVSDGAGPHEST